MTDKNSPEIVPNNDILIRVCLTPTDIPLCFFKGLTGGKALENDTETLHKIGLSVRIEILPERLTIKSQA